MNDELTFRSNTAGILLTAFVISGYHRRRAQRVGGAVSRSGEGRPILFTLRLFGAAAWLSVMVYVFKPEWLAWATLASPVWLRWLGVAMVHIPTKWERTGFSAISRSCSTALGQLSSGWNSN